MKRKSKKSKEVAAIAADVDRTKITMKQIIEMDDSSLEPMAKKVADEHQITEAATAVPPPPPPSSSSAPTPGVVQFRFNPATGKIEVDQSSLTAGKTLSIREKEAEREEKTRQDLYRRRVGSKKRWTQSETLRFYQALRTFGTDFTLIAGVFASEGRDRAQVKAKFKAEEKTHPDLVDFALLNSLPITEEKLQSAGIIVKQPQKPQEPLTPVEVVVAAAQKEVPVPNPAPVPAPAPISEEDRFDDDDDGGV